MGGQQSAQQILQGDPNIFQRTLGITPETCELPTSETIHVKVGFVWLNANSQPQIAKFKMEDQETYTPIILDTFNKESSLCKQVVRQLLKTSAGEANNTSLYQQLRQTVSDEPQIGWFRKKIFNPVTHFLVRPVKSEEELKKQIATESMTYADSLNENMYKVWSLRKLQSSAKLNTYLLLIRVANFRDVESTFNKVKNENLVASDEATIQDLSGISDLVNEEEKEIFKSGIMGYQRYLQLLSTSFDESTLKTFVEENPPKVLSETDIDTPTTGDSTWYKKMQSWVSQPSIGGYQLGFGGKLIGALGVAGALGSLGWKSMDKSTQKRLKSGVSSLFSRKNKKMEEMQAQLLNSLAQLTEIKELLKTDKLKKQELEDNMENASTQLDGVILQLQELVQSDEEEENDSELEDNMFDAMESDSDLNESEDSDV
jgi:hypothetical protein